MSKLDFKHLVLEVIEAVPDWYKEIIKIYNENTGSTLSDVIPPTDGRLYKTYMRGILGDTKNVSPTQIAIEFLSLFDLFVSLKEIEQIKKTTTTSIETFINKVTEQIESEKVLEVLQVWKNKNIYTWQDYMPISGQGGEVQRKALGDVDRLGAVALNTLNTESILGATQKIVTKRISSIEAIISLRSPNFNNLIKDIFNRLPGYVSGSIKVTKDFEKLVDNLYITNIFTVAANAMLFYDSLIDRFTGQEQLESRSLIIPTNKQKINEAETATIIAAGLAAAGITGALLNKIRQKPYDPGFMKFVETGIFEQSDIKYDIQQIQKIGTTEGRQLIASLQRIAQYTKKKPGASEIVGQAAGALGALSVGMGPVN
jgi:hypothetical protein